MKYSLPESANDLLIKDGRLLMKSLAIYEVLRRFGHIIRLAPFKFEDFTAALLAEDQSALLAEIHLQLLKTLIRDDRQQQTWLGPTDIRDSVNIYLHLTDHSNWPAALRIYLSADVLNNSETLNQLSGDASKSYPFQVELEVRLDVLDYLCYRFLSTALARDEIVNGTNIATTTSDLQESNDADYQATNSLKRHDPICIDKLGRRYWFIVRRLFVVDETEDEIRYYTTIAQLDEVIQNLKGEKSLLDSLEEQYEEIKRQMQITEDLYSTLLKDHKRDDGTYSLLLGQDGTHRSYANNQSNNVIVSKAQASIDRDISRSLGNKFCVAQASSFKWFGAIDGHLNTISSTLRTTILKLEALFPPTFLHPCWQTQRASWIRSLNCAQKPREFAIALTKFESAIKHVVFKSTWTDSVGFIQLFRSTFLEREELKKTDRQPRGFERRECVSADFEFSYRNGTMVKFSSKLKPVKHQVWKQKGEEYRLTGLNGWYWLSITYRSNVTPKLKPVPKSKESKPSENGDIVAQNGNDDDIIKFHGEDVGFNWQGISKKIKQAKMSTCVMAKPKLQPYHDFQSRRNKIRSLLVLPQLELRKLARSGGLRETKSFNYSAKQNSHIWPYGMTPRPSFRLCWLYKNQIVGTIQDVALQLRVFHACFRWDELQTKPPASGRNTIVTDESTITIELLKKRERLPYLSHSEYLIRKVTTPIEQPATKYRKVGGKKAATGSRASITPSRSGLRARRQVEEEEEKGPMTEEIWVPEEQLELWELKQFDERIERQKALMRERALREEADKRRKIEEEKRRAAEQERRRVRSEEEAAKRARLSDISANNSMNPATPQKTNSINIPTTQQPRSQQPATPVLRYFRTEAGQIIRLPASYLQRGTPLILRHISPGTNQTNTYIIRPQGTTIPSPNGNITLRMVAPAPLVTGTPTAATKTPATTATTTIPATTATTSTIATAAVTTIATTATATTTATVTTAPTTATTATATTTATVTTAPTTATTATAAATSITTATTVPATTSPATTTATTAPTAATTATATTTATTTTAPTTAAATSTSTATTAAVSLSVSATLATIGSTSSGDERPLAPAATETLVALQDSKPQGLATESGRALGAVAGHEQEAAARGGEEEGAKVAIAGEPEGSVGTVASEMAHDQHAPAASS